MLYSFLTIFILLCQSGSCFSDGSATTSLQVSQIATPPSMKIVATTRQNSPSTVTTFHNGLPQNYTANTANLVLYQIDMQKYNKWCLLDGNARSIALELAGNSLVQMLGVGGSPKIINSSSVYLAEYKRVYHYESVNRSQLTTYITGRCSYEIGQNDLFNLKFQDGERVTSITYQCNTSTEICCNGLKCCTRFPSIYYGGYVNNFAANTVTLQNSNALSSRMSPQMVIYIVSVSSIVFTCILAVCYFRLKRYCNSADDNLKSTTIVHPYSTTTYTQPVPYNPNWHTLPPYNVFSLQPSMNEMPPGYPSPPEYNEMAPYQHQPVVYHLPMIDYHLPGAFEKEQPRG